VSIEQSLKIILYGKSGKPVKTLKAAKYYEIYFKNSLVLQRRTSHKIQENKRLAIEKAYADTFTYIFLEQKVLKEKLEKYKVPGSSGVLPVGKAKILLKTITSLALKSHCNIKILDFTLHKSIRLTKQTKKAGTLKLIYKIFKPYLINFIKANVRPNKENAWLFRIKYSTKHGKKLIKTGYGKKRLFSQNADFILKLSEMSIYNVFKMFYKKLEEYMGKNFAKHILIDGFTMEYILNKKALTQEEIDALISKRQRKYKQKSKK